MWMKQVKQQNAYKEEMVPERRHKIMAKNFYLVRILIAVMTGFLVGVVTGYSQNPYILALTLAIVMTTFFLYEGLSYEKTKR